MTTPAFAEVPGLLAKVWLADPESNTYGGVYNWKDRSAMEAFQKSSFFKDVASHPNLKGFRRRTSRSSRGRRA